jgi:hypothetical protein
MYRNEEWNRIQDFLSEEEYISSLELQKEKEKRKNIEKVKKDCKVFFMDKDEINRLYPID